MVRVLVTGAAGFIGSHLYHHVLSQGHDVITLDDYSTGDRRHLHVRDPEAKNRRWLLEGSVTDERDVGRAMALAPDVVFHLAAQIDVRASVTDPIADAGTNVMGTVRMLAAAAETGVRRFVFVSTAAVFGDYAPPVDLNPRDGMRVGPISPYGASKAAADLYVELYNRMGVYGHHNMSTSTVVLSNVYGPRQRPGFGAVNLFTRSLLTGQPVTLYGDGFNTRDYVYVGDAVRALAAAAEPGAFGRTLVGTGVGTTDRALFVHTAAEVGCQLPGGLPGEQLFTMGPAGHGDLRASVFPRYDDAMVPLAEGLKLTVEAVRKEMGTHD